MMPSAQQKARAQLATNHEAEYRVLYLMYKQKNGLGKNSKSRHNALTDLVALYLDEYKRLYQDARRSGLRSNWNYHKQTPLKNKDINEQPVPE